MLPEEAWERLARLLDLFGVIGALLAMRLAACSRLRPIF
jgi:hypothetical protein